MIIGSESQEESDRRESMMASFRESCARHGVPLSWALAIARHESHFRNLRSSEGQRDDLLGGSWGPMQVSSDRAKLLGIQRHMTPVERGEWLKEDPARGIEAGCQFIRNLMTRGADYLELVCAGFNGGPAWVDRRAIPRQTRETYIPDVLKFQAEYAFLDSPAQQEPAQA